MKIGLITLFGENYGNKLQNYAVQYLLDHKKEAYEMGMCDFREGFDEE